MKLDIGDGVESNKCEHVIELGAFYSHKERVPTLNQEQQDQCQENPTKNWSGCGYFIRISGYILRDASFSLKSTLHQIHSQLIPEHINNESGLETYA